MRGKRLGRIGKDGRTATRSVVHLSVIAAMAFGLMPGSPASGSQLEPRVAETHPLPVEVEERVYATLSPEGEPSSDMRWRVVEGTGNCCENYLAVTPQGRLLDIGGTYMNFSDDEGLSWRRVALTSAPRISRSPGEGTVSVAPNGDVLAVTWWPYEADILIAIKFDAGTETWHEAFVPLHEPFYDRPWLAVIPGPIRVDGVDYPYISVLKSGWSAHDETWRISTDGLHYERVSVRAVDELTSPRAERWLDEPATPAADWSQPHIKSALTPLPGGGALTGPDYFQPRRPWQLLEPQSPHVQWRPFALPGGEKLPAGQMVIDSQSTLHHVQGRSLSTSFTYSASTSGGREWQKTSFTLPDGMTVKGVKGIDIKANAAAGVSAVAVTARTESGTPKNLVYKFSLDEGMPQLERILVLGNGEYSGWMDFPTVAILPDGRIAASFGDAEYGEPTVAIELATHQMGTELPLVEVHRLTGQITARTVVGRGADVSGVGPPSVSVAEFEQSCEIPATQGLDGYIFKVPEELRGKTMIAEASIIRGGSDLDLYFYDSECKRLALAATSGYQVDERAAIPPHTAFIAMTAYAGADIEAVLRFLMRGAKVAFTEASATRGTFSDTAHLEALVIDTAGGAVIENATLSFELGSSSVTATTDATGLATVQLPLVDPPGDYDVRVRFAGDGDRAASEERSPFSIIRETLQLSLTKERDRSTTILTATLVDPNSPPVGVAGARIEFYIGGQLLGDALTDGNGIARVAVHNGSLRDGVVEAVFPGDDLYEPVSAVIGP